MLSTSFLLPGSLETGRQAATEYTSFRILTVAGIIPASARPQGVYLTRP